MLTVLRDNYFMAAGVGGVGGVRGGREGRWGVGGRATAEYSPLY